MAAEYFIINSPAVINETIEGESVIINLETGFYYSLDTTGAYIWEALAHAESLSDIVSLLQTRYAESAETIKAAVTSLIDALTTEKLLLPSPTPAHQTAADDRHLTSVLPETFSRPHLNKFGDMQDLLLLDPIHEVDDAGWPHTKPEDAKE